MNFGFVTIFGSEKPLKAHQKWRYRAGCGHRDRARALSVIALLHLFLKWLLYFNCSMLTRQRLRLSPFGDWIAPAESDRTGFEIARPYFQADRNTFFDPLPVFVSAALVALVDEDGKGPAAIGDCCKLVGDLSANAN